jgi:hypothetical protein
MARCLLLDLRISEADGFYKHAAEAIETAKCSGALKTFLIGAISTELFEMASDFVMNWMSSSSRLEMASRYTTDALTSYQRSYGTAPKAIDYDFAVQFGNDVFVRFPGLPPLNPVLAARRWPILGNEKSLLELQNEENIFDLPPGSIEYIPMTQSGQSTAYAIRVVEGNGEFMKDGRGKTMVLHSGMPNAILRNNVQ